MKIIRSLTEEQHRYVDLLIKLVGMCGVILAFLWGLHQYNIQKHDAFKRHLWEQQLALYLEATKTASTIAYPRAFADESEQELLKAEERFWQLYYGEMIVIEDPAVGAAMVSFGYCLREFKLENCSRRELIARATSLAQASRSAVARSWKEKLGDAATRE